ncbi:MAG: alkaline phosphatase family protein, partial [Deltaproteobacteria bacterium]|nr:alkaline phosphatase family protein [Deltaproteobacteria bacterium]
MPTRSVIIILADGARFDVMRDLMQKQQLPHISENLPHLREGTTAFPSTTGPAYLPYLAGCYPGTCNVPGIRWFDKDAYARGMFFHKKFRSYVGAETFFMSHDIRDGIQTIFELVPNAHNISNGITRGVKRRNNRTGF